MKHDIEMIQVIFTILYFCKKNKMKYFLIVILFANSIQGQTILNTESLLGKATNSLTTQLHLSANWESGNENSFITFNQILIGIRREKQLWRLVVAHDFEEDEGIVTANDWSGQLRLNHFTNNNSIYAFAQGQSIRVLQMNHRYLFGGGYRFSLLKNESQYIDIGTGFFYENEEYPTIRFHKLRYNVNAFLRIKVLKKLFFNCVTYAQFNSKNTEDIRLFIEPKVDLEQKRYTLSFIAQNRYHSMPYQLNKKNDLTTSLILSFNLFDKNL
jgi:hypothetical protein